MQKVKQKIKQKPRFSTVLLRLGCIGLGLYLVITLVYSQVTLASQRAALGNLNRQVTEQQTQNKELARVLEAGDEAAVMESIAREKLGYAAPDERVFVDMSGN